MIYYSLPGSQFAQAYGNGPYSSCPYNGCTTTNNTNGGGANLLTNTGFDIAAIITIACLVVAISALIRWWHRPHAGHGQAAQQARSDAAKESRSTKKP